MVKISLTLSSLWLLGFLMLSPSVNAQNLTVQVDRNPIHQDETVKLLIRLEGDTGGDSPDFGVLEDHFEVLGTTESNSIKIINGQTTSSKEWLATLMPKHTGGLTLPSLHVGQAQSTPLQLTVLAAEQPHNIPEGRDIFLETSLTPNAPYVQSQLVYTVRLFHAIPLQEGQITDPPLPNTLIKRLGEDVSFETMRYGRSYHVTERKFLIIPEKSGPLTIPPTIFTGTVIDSAHQQPSRNQSFQNGSNIFGSEFFRSFSTPLKPARARSQELTVTVKPIPAHMHGQPWLPSEELRLSESWSIDIAQAHPNIHIGDPLTRTITMKVKGMMGEHLPDISLQESSKSLNVYPDQPKKETLAENANILGIREQKIALVPTKAGRLTIPEIRVSWWDIHEDAKKTAVLPARTFTILPQGGQALQYSSSLPQDSRALTPLPTSEQSQQETLSDATQTPIDSGSVPGLWPSLAGVFFLAWVITIIGWWRTRLSPPHHAAIPSSETSSSLAQAYKAIRAASTQQSRQQTKEALLRWGAIRWKQQPPRSLGNLAGRFLDHQAQTALRELDRMLYTASESCWDGASFWKIMAPVLQKGHSAVSRKSPNPLPSLHLELENSKAI
ncbi:MAG: hypothetical protein GKS05_11105 [Nitrospirales bacterium]|nr:hypothetical protein [Nitrospirales bacterium]